MRAWISMRGACPAFLLTFITSIREAAPIAAPVTGSAGAEQDGGPRTRKGRSEAEDGSAVARTAWLRQDRGVDGAAIGFPKDEGGAERRRMRSRRGAFSGLIGRCYGIDRERALPDSPVPCTFLVEKPDGTRPMTTSFTWDDIAAIYLSQPWWVWLVGAAAAWFGTKLLIGAMRAYRERAVSGGNSFKQCGVEVDFRTGTITLPRGGRFPVERVRGEDYARSGTYHAIIEVDDMVRPIHPVAFSTPAGPEAFVSSLRTAIERAGGPQFALAANEKMEIVERDLSDPVMAAVATRVGSLGRRVSYPKAD